MKLSYYHNEHLHGLYKFDRENTLEPISDKDHVRKPSGGDLVLISPEQFIEAKIYIASLNCYLSPENKGCALCLIGLG